MTTQELEAGPKTEIGLCLLLTVEDHERLKLAAKVGCRSLRQEVLYRLRQSLRSIEQPAS
jgi:hypothetical protein